MDIELKRLIAEVWKHKKKVFAIAVAGIVYGICTPLMGLLLKTIGDSFQKGDSWGMEQAGLTAVGLGFLLAVSRYFQIYLMNYTAEMVVNKVRLQFQKKLMQLNLSYHLKYKGGPGGLLSRSLNDIRTIQDGLRMVADFFREPLVAVGMIGNLLYLDWKLTLGLLVILPLILVFLRQLSKSLRKYVLLGQEELEKITSIIKESLDGVRVIQSYNLEQMMGQKLEQQTDDYLELRRRLHARVEIMSPVTEFLATIMIIAVFFYFFKQHSTIGDVMAYVGSIMMLNPPIKKLQESYVRIQETIIAARRVYEIIDAPEVVPEAPRAISFPQNWNEIRFENVGFSFQDHRILSQVNFSVKKGEHIAFVGLSGSGKSSIVNLLPRFFDPTEGHIFIDQHDLKSIGLQDLRKNVSLVSQDVFLFNESIEKNILAGDLARDARFVPEAAQAANARDFVELRPHSFQSPVGDRGSLLSGGEKQRISIARAIFKDAPILILDEATSALDSTSEKEVQRGIDSLLQGRTALIIAHRLSTIQKCDRIYLVKNGTIISAGSHQTLLNSSPEYQELYHHQGMI